MTRFITAFMLVMIWLGAAPSAQAAIVTYFAVLDGPSEAPPNASPGTGNATVDFDIIAHTMRVRATFAGLIGNSSAAHIHAPTASPGTGVAGVATQVPTFSNFPLGVTSGTYDMTFDTTLASTFNPAFVTANGGTAAGAEMALFNSLNAGTAYFNLHSTSFPGGEIRGFLFVVPEPSSVLMMSLSVGVLGACAYRQRRKAQRKGDLS